MLSEDIIQLNVIVLFAKTAYEVWWLVDFSAATSVVSKSLALWAGRISYRHVHDNRSDHCI